MAGAALKSGDRCAITKPGSGAGNSPAIPPSDFFRINQFGSFTLTDKRCCFPFAAKVLFK